MKTIRRPSAFTLIELLVVISIIAILAALTVPALKNIGKSNSQTSAARQLMDDIGRARQYAINNHSSVYMVFVPTNFANTTFINGLNTIPNANDRQLALTTATNLVAGQLTAYTFVSLGKLGDQPGRHTFHYIDSWKYLPDGTMIYPVKFQTLIKGPTLWIQNYNPVGTTIFNFSVTAIPFPTEASPAISMPSIQFNYLGQAINNNVPRDEYIMLDQGYVNYPINPAKIPILSASSTSTVVEVPPGNATNTSYNIIHITGLTGRVGLESFLFK